MPVCCVVLVFMSTAGAPELVAHSREEYEELAMTYATNHMKRMVTSAKLLSLRHTSPLFDTKQLVHSLETAYKLLYEATMLQIQHHIIIHKPER